MSNLFHGTPSHMAPELMLKGHMSKAADTYAFGVTLWELFTMDSAFQGIPPALLGHKGIPPALLGHEAPGPAKTQGYPRAPSFQDIMDRLMAMRSELHGPLEEMRSHQGIPDAKPSLTNSFSIQPNPEASLSLHRPSFQNIMDRLMAMRSELHGPSEILRSHS
eukprot:gene5108-34910_t